MSKAGEQGFRLLKQNLNRIHMFFSFFIPVAAAATSKLAAPERMSMMLLLPIFHLHPPTLPHVDNENSDG